MISFNKTLGKFQLVGIPPATRGMPQIEVSFDIDANGIINVSAKDLGTGNEQQIRIEGGSGLSEDEVERMISEAESHAGEAHQLRELADARNAGEQLAYQTERTLAEHRDKLDEATGSTIEGRIMELRQAVEGSDVADIQAKTEALDEALALARGRDLRAGVGGAGRVAAQPSGNGGGAPRTRSSRTPTSRSSTRRRRRRLVSDGAHRERRSEEPGRSPGSGSAGPTPTTSRRLAAERDEYLDLLQRVQADFENYRKRAARDQERLVAHAHERLVRELLPVLDDLERALEAAERHEEAELVDGVKLVEQSLRKALEKEGLDRDRDRRAVRPARPRGAARAAGTTRTVVSRSSARYRRDGRRPRVIVADAAYRSSGDRGRPRPRAREVIVRRHHADRREH